MMLRGVIPILPAPFTPDGAVDEDSFARAVEAALADGVHGVAMFGLASEYYKLTDLERARLTGEMIRIVDSRVPAIISITAHATRVAVAEARRAAEAGAAALMVMPPFFLGPPVSATVNHVRAIAAAVAPLPVIVQYAPIQTGRVIDVQTFTALHQDLPNIACIKVDLVPSGPMIGALRENGLPSLVGYSGLHLPEDFTRGVSGVMPTVALGRAFVCLWKLLEGGDERAARSLHRDLLPLLNFTMQSIEMLIACEKELLVRRGIVRTACCREPAHALDAVQRRELERHAARLVEWLPRFE